VEQLTAVQARVLGALTEKLLTTPQYYPLTLHALVAACNQTSNRAPVTSYTAHEVQDALDELKAAGLARLVHPSHGERSTKYRQVLDEVLGLDAAERALLCALLLRGAQTTAELRARTERLHEFRSTTEVEDVLERLAARAEPLVARTARQPGQKEARWAQLLGPSDAVVDERFAARDDGTADDGRADLAARVGLLEDEVARLRAELDALRDLLS
jgi:uncharacterized protein YceH (UPF0502 family)